MVVFTNNSLYNKRYNVISQFEYKKDKNMGEIALYHGNDHILKEPKYGYGKSDNDYGQGFYTTKDKERAIIIIM